MYRNTSRKVLTLNMHTRSQIKVFKKTPLVGKMSGQVPYPLLEKPRVVFNYIKEIEKDKKYYAVMDVLDDAIWKVYAPTNNTTALHLYVEAKDTSSRSTVKRSGGGMGKLDAASEDGFFHKVNKSHLEKLKQQLKQQEAIKGFAGQTKKPEPQ